MEDKKTLFLR